jgi:hypothetical protein
MTDDGGSSLSRRLHWEPEPDPDASPDPGNAPASDDNSWDDDPADDARTEAVVTSGGGVAAGPSFERRQLDRMDEEALDRRRQLWRDTSLILSGLLVVLILANVVLPQLTGSASASPTAVPTGVVVGGLGTPGPSAGAAPTPVGPPSPSPRLSSTPFTPPPAVTQPPTGTAAPTRPGETAHPTPTPRRTPTPAPTPTPTPTPEITPEVTPIPAPNAVVTCDPPVGLTVTCTSTSTHELAGSEVWDMGGSGVLVSGGNGSSTITWTYADVSGSPYTVTLTVTGLDGVTTDSDTTQVTL